jgi:hypothetical protein
VISIFRTFFLKLQNNFKINRVILKIAVFICAFACIERFCHKMTGGFAVSKIIADSKPVLYRQRDVPISDEKLLQFAHLLDQPYYFYAKGGQCFIFVGEDGKTIIKFFKNHHIRFWNWLSAISFPFSLDDWRVKLLEKHRHQTQDYLFQSCKIAYEKFKEQTGLIYLQFANEPLMRKKLVIYDKLMIAHTIELGNTDFVIQKKAAPVCKTFKQLIKQNNLELCKCYIDAMLDLITERCRQGIGDRDFNVRTNLGLLEDQIIEIDIGSYHDNLALKEPESMKIELLIQTQKFHKWLEKHHEGLAHYLYEKINTL